MSRRTVLVVAGLAVLAVVLAFVGQRRDAPATSMGALLVPGLAESLNDVNRITVTRAGGAPVATLVRGEAGWSVMEKDGYPADVAKIRQALVGLSEARIVEAKTSNPAFHARLGVEAIEGETATGVAIAIEGATPYPVLILGDAPKSANRYVRRATEEASFLIDRNPEVPSMTSQWLVTEIVDVPSAGVESVTIKHRDGQEIAISKASASDTTFTVADIPAGRELSYAGVANVIGNALRELKLDDVAPAAATPATPSSVTEFRTFDGLIVTVTSTPDGENEWLTFAARAEPPAAAPSTAPDAAAAGAPGESTAPGAEAEAASTAASAADPVAQAAAINARVAGWRYRIPDYQRGQLTRRWSDLLKAS